MSDDLISKKDAIDAAIKAACDWVNGDAANLDEGISFAIQTNMEAIPAVEPVVIHQAQAKLAKAVEAIKDLQATVASSKVPIAGLIRHKCKVVLAELGEK